MAKETATQKLQKLELEHEKLKAENDKLRERLASAEKYR